MFGNQLTKEFVILKYRNAKEHVSQLYDPEILMEVIAQMRIYEGLNEGRDLAYLASKIDQGIELDDEEYEEIMSTLALYQYSALIGESGEVVEE